MNCHSVRELMSPFLDNELEDLQRLEVERHIESCIACAELHFQYSQLTSGIRADAPYYSAPEELRSRIVQTLEHSAAGIERARPRWTSMVIAAAAGFLFAVSLFFVQRFAMPHREKGAPDFLAQELVASHVRSLMANHLFDVQSTDQHTVKPWFAGKIDFSPKVKDLTAEADKLIGGRLDYLDGRPVAAIVYQRHQHVINLFVWPAGQEKAPDSTIAVNGFNLVGWQQAGLVYWAVSDLNMAELHEFARAYAD